MPIYEFECKPCNKRFEILVSLSRIAEVKCPDCGLDDIERVMSMFSARTTGGDGSSHSHGDCAGCAAGQCSTCSCH